MTTTRLAVPEGFSLAAVSDFYAGFSPMGGAAARRAGRLELAQLLDGTYAPVHVVLEEDAAGLRLTSDETKGRAALERQLTRMLGLDVDGRAWAALGERDSAVGRLQREFPGFFTAGFPSPFEAGVGGVLSHRSSIRQAAALRRKVSELHGTRFGALAVMPTPRQWLALTSVPGLAAQKLEVIQGLARAALEGKLEADALRALPVDDALERLERLHGIGPWTAGHMLFRGATVQDAVPTTEPRVQRAFEVAMGAPASTFEARAAGWAPFRMWVCILMVRHLAAAGQFGSPRGEREQRGAPRKKQPRQLKLEPAAHG